MSGAPVALVALLLAPALLAGCLADDPQRDGRAYLYFVNQGPAASAKLVGDAGVVWSGRLLPGEGELVEVETRVGGCADYTLFAGYEGREPDQPVRLVAPCDRDLPPMRVEFRRPEPRNGTA